jgi:DNA polymerase III delta prime subunit
MARLTPSFIDDRSPPGEKEIFSLLEAGPAEWTALHSLDLAPWNRSLRTEVDFIVIVPDTGILCIEVKSHKEIRFDGSRWTPQDIKRSPFKQAADARYVFHRRLSEIAARFASLPVVHCCIFTHSTFEMSRNLSVQPWELMDSRQLRSFKTADEFCGDLKTRIARSIQADGALHPLRDPLTQSLVDELVGYCVPVYRATATKRDEIDHRARKAEEHLRIQQRPVLKLASTNERLIVSGPAGTGKTLIALELARLKAESGLRVGFFCFNQLIGDSLRSRVEETKPRLPNLVVDRAIRALATMAQISIPEAPTSQFWASEFVELVRDRLGSTEFCSAAAFDYLVLDEAQDLLARPALFECLARLLQGGLRAGQFAFFGDFENQVLAEREPLQETLRAVKEVSRPASWDLSENCRNYKLVGEMALKLSAASADTYSGYMRVGGSVHDYDIAFYQSADRQEEQVRYWLAESSVQGYLPSEISIISFCAIEKSIVSRLGDANLSPAWKVASGTSYASAVAFKGMENKVIIVTDVDVTDSDFQRNLFYTALTRATERVRIACTDASMSTLKNWMLGRK